MLVVKMELWPGGDESAKRELSRVVIVNDETGTPELGNYDVTVTNEAGEVVKRDRVTGWSRERGGWSLLHRAMSKGRKRV